LRHFATERPPCVIAITGRAERTGQGPYLNLCRERCFGERYIGAAAMTTRTPPPRLSLSDIRSELEHLPSDELRALSRAIARVLEEREKPRRML
jgi:hypothetical protein